MPFLDLKVIYIHSTQNDLMIFSWVKKGGKEEKTFERQICGWSSGQWQGIVKTIQVAWYYKKIKESYVSVSNQITFKSPQPGKSDSVHDSVNDAKLTLLLIITIKLDKIYEAIVAWIEKQLMPGCYPWKKTDLQLCQLSV